MGNDNLKRLHGTLAEDGYDVPALDKFESDMSDSNKRRTLYDNIIGEYDLPDYDTFTNDIVGVGREETDGDNVKNKKVREANIHENRLSVWESMGGESFMPYDKMRAAMDGGDDSELSRIYTEYKDKTGAIIDYKDWLGLVKPTKKNGSRGYDVLDDVGAPADKMRSLTMQEGGKHVDVPYTDVYDDIERFAKNHPRATIRDTYGNWHHVEEFLDGRLRLPELSQEEIDSARRYTDEYKRKSFDAEAVKGSASDLAKEINERYAELCRPISEYDAVHGNIGASGNNGRVVSAAKRSMDRALSMIDEADKARKEGDFDGFVKGAFRGLKDGLFDITTWDLGINDALDGKAILDALKKADAGEELSRDERLLLDAKANETAVNAYFSSYIGRGYKAGKVTAESIPFMIEFCVNPMAAAGTSAQSMMLRYALKKFGKEALKKGGSRYASELAKRIAVRAAGDVGGAVGMAATTGQGRVIAETLNRMSGNVLYDLDENGNVKYTGRVPTVDDVSKAYFKSLGNRAIENHSEMLGKYFAPIIGKVGDAASFGVAKAAAKSRPLSIGVQKVRGAINDIRATDMAAAVDGLTRKARWDGTIGEYAEEVCGNIENALMVGDLDFTSGENGVFNLDRNIDTFLGVALMGGFLDGVRIAGGRKTGDVEKQKRKLSLADRVGRVAFGEDWNSVRGSLDTGTDDERKVALMSVVRGAGDGRKVAAALDYAYEVDRLMGLEEAERKKASDDMVTPIEAVAQSSRDAGASLSYEDYRNVRASVEAARSELGDDIAEALDGFVGDNADASQIDYFIDALPPDKASAAMRYFSAKNAELGELERIETEADEAADAVRMSEERFADEDGNVTWIVRNMDGNRYAVKMIDGGIIFAVDEKGNDCQISDDDVLETDEPYSVESKVEEAREKRMAELMQVFEFKSRHHPKTTPNKTGDVITDGNGAYYRYIDGEDGKPYLQPLSIGKDGKFEAKGKPVETTGDDVLYMKDAMHDEEDRMHGQTADANTGSEPLADYNSSDEADAMPMDGEEPEWGSVSPARSRRYIYEESGLDKEDADAFVWNKVEEARSRLDEVSKARPKVGLSMSAFNSEMSKWMASVEAARSDLDYWSEVRGDERKREDVGNVESDVDVGVGQSSTELEDAEGTVNPLKEEDGTKVNEPDVDSDEDVGDGNETNVKTDDEEEQVTREDVNAAATEAVIEALERNGSVVVVMEDEGAVPEGSVVLGGGGNVYGWAVGNEIHLTPSGINTDVPVHEYAHLWARSMRNGSPKRWARIKDLLRGTSVWDDVVKDEAYSSLRSDDDAVAGEVLARFSGSAGARRIEELRAGMSEGGSSAAYSASVIGKIKKALDDFWQWVSGLFGISGMDDAGSVADMVITDLLSGVELDGLEGGSVAEFNTTAVVRNMLVGIKNQFDAMMNSGMVKAIETWQDSMVSLRKLQELLAEMSNKPIQDYENAYMAETAMSSVNMAEQEEFRNTKYRGLIDKAVEVGNAILGNGGVVLKNGDIKELSNVGASDMYLMAKHGVERNRHMAVVSAIEEDSKSVIDEAARANFISTKEIEWANDKESVWNNGKTWAEQEEELDDIARSKYGADLSLDYSGLTGVFGIDGMPNETIVTHRSFIYSFVSGIDNGADTDGLTRLVRECTSATLDKQVSSGVMSSAVRDMIDGMYRYYVPLRGWEDGTSEDVYDYLNTPKQHMQRLDVKAKGRRSEADSPLAAIGAMADTAIAFGNRNLVKQKFLTMVEQRPNDYVVETSVYAKLDDQRSVWEMVPPPTIAAGSTPEQVSVAMQRHESDMEDKCANEPDKYRRMSRDSAFSVRVLQKSLGEHRVTVYRGGTLHLLTCFGSPRVSQALNGMTNPANVTDAAVKAAEWIKRQMSTNFTSRNPEFVIRNLIRDGLFSMTMVHIKESRSYASRFSRNWVDACVRLGGLYRKWSGGNLDINDPLENMFLKFMRNGGETGFTVINDIERQKRKIEQYAKEGSRSKVNPIRIAKYALNMLESLNRWAENISRFSAFRTSMECGRSVARSVNDAKEITVNFNRKGGGSTVKGEFKDGNRLHFVGSYLSDFCRTSYVFWNAGVQGTSNLFRSLRDNPKNGTAYSMLWAGLGGIGMLAINWLSWSALSALSGGGDDGDRKSFDGALEEYFKLPDYLRRNNLCVSYGSGWVAIPLSIELRMFFGIGDIVMGQVTGMKRYGGVELYENLAGAVTSCLPLNFMESGEFGLTGFIPSYLKPFSEWYSNTDWAGRNIERRNEFSKHNPSWMNASRNVTPWLVSGSRWLNTVTSGGDVVANTGIDINPSMVHHYANGYLGGVASVTGKTVNTVTSVWRSGVEILDGKSVIETINDNVELRHIPIVSGIIKGEYPSSEERIVSEEYSRNIRVFDEISRVRLGYRKLVRSGGVPDGMGSYYKERLKKFEELSRLSSKFRKMRRTVSKFGNYAIGHRNEDGVYDSYIEMKRKANESFDAVKSYMDENGITLNIKAIDK